VYTVYIFLTVAAATCYS